WWLYQDAVIVRTSVESGIAQIKNLQDRANWAEAQALLGQVSNRLGNSRFPDLQQRLAQASHDLQIGRQLEEIRLAKLMPEDELYGNKGSAQRYQKAFRDWGVDIFVDDQTTIVQRILCSPIQRTLMDALDDLAILEIWHQERAN